MLPLTLRTLTFQRVCSKHIRIKLFYIIYNNIGQVCSIDYKFAVDLMFQSHVYATFFAYLFIKQNNYRGFSSFVSLTCHFIDSNLILISASTMQAQRTALTMLY